ncbi:unannotated protein [freshwater metagenome]|uniref:Unannotated protein n=1 Tax=freshwater metagenome TaxID=449393 RepID=A0A6J7H9Y8_9ZZZZ|nr:hypothetical protein [Actinomycetota bacterium]
MKRKLLSLILVIASSQLVITPAFAAIDLQADLNRIVAGINRFDANSATSSSIRTMKDVKRIFKNNDSILREIGEANAAFKRDLNSAKRQIPSKDTKETPAFNTLMNLTKGYEEWLRYQNMDQASSIKCIKNAGISLNIYLQCAISLLPKTAEHERIGRQKLQAAWDDWKKWQVKYGYA